MTRFTKNHLMNRSLTPTISLVALACMVAAGTSHWWSVKQLVAVVDVPQIATRVHAQEAERTEPQVAAMAATPATAVPDATPEPLPATASRQPVPTESAAMQEFYQELIREMQHLRTQNRDLLNQVAETNRDLMKLEFRVDTHSEQFRPLPVAEDHFGTTFGTSFDDGPGLLPPRAEPVVLPFAE